MGDRLGDISAALRQAERELRKAVSIAGEYRGPAFKELAAREVHRKGVKALIRVGELADRIESRSKSNV